MEKNNYVIILKTIDINWFSKLLHIRAQDILYCTYI